MKTLLKPVLLICLWSATGASELASADEETDRETLRTMLTTVEQAINERNINDVLDYFLPQSVVVFQNKTVLRGPDDLNKFFEKMLGSSNSVLTDVSSKATIGAPASFYGPDTAVANGTLIDLYTFRGGSTMQLESAWTTTVVRLDDRWRIASLHFSADVFDNPIIDNTKRFILWAAIGGLLTGLVLTWVFMRRRSKSA